MSRAGEVRAQGTARRGGRGGLIAAALILLSTGVSAPRPLAQPQPESAATPGGGEQPPLLLLPAPPPPPHWTEDTRRQLADALGGALRHGLDASPVASFKDLDTASDPALTAAALRYATALAMGQTDPRRLHTVFELRRNSIDLAAGLSAAVTSGQLATWLNGLAPSDAEYRALSDAYLAARARGFAQSAHSIAAGPPIAPGASDPRVRAIARRLVDHGDLAHPPARPKGKAKDKAKDKAKATVYAAAIVAAVKLVQADNGLAPDGVVDAATLRVLNGGLGPKARTLAVNLERLRWLARDPPRNRIDVNIATAELSIYEAGAVVDRRKVIVGAPGHETPPIEASFSRIVVNPPWYVPPDIARREILPKGRGYMARHGMVWRDGRIVQKPGRASALGQVKFDLQDEHAIYLHDTPEKRLFGRAGRHLSHGCVRVENAVGLAETLAGTAGRTADLEDALASSATHTVSLGADIPVRMFYLTAFADDGAVRYAADVYGWDDDVAQALGLGAAVRRQRPQASVDEGP
jgi:murein L,D-transpeptidase YcbB/YkuD